MPTEPGFNRPLSTVTRRETAPLSLDAAGPTEAAVWAALGRVLASQRFVAAPRVREFLEFVVAEQLAGRGPALKAYTIATGAFRYPDDFDPGTDPYVRIVAGRVRRALAAHYGEEGCADPVRIEIPKGAYAPSFVRAPIDEIVEPRTAGRTGAVEVEICRFEYHGPDERAWLASGLTEALVDGLGRFEELRIRGPLLPATPMENRGFRVAGSVHCVGPTVRVRARVADETGTNLWAERYDRELDPKHLFDLQDDIALRVVGALGGMAGVIGRTLGIAAREVPSAHANAYEAVLKAYHWNNVLTDAAFHDACDALQQAVVENPDSALARALLSDMYFSDWLSDIGYLDGGLDEAERLAREAVDLEPRSAQSRWALGQVHFGRRRGELVVSEYELALELAPHRASTLASYAAWLVGLGEWDHAATIQRRAERLNPELPAWTNYAPFMLAAREDDWAGALARATRFSASDLVWGPLSRAVALQQLGREDDARAEVAALVAQHPDFAVRGIELMRRLLWHPENVALFVEPLRLVGLELPLVADD